MGVAGANDAHASLHAHPTAVLGRVVGGQLDGRLARLPLRAHHAGADAQAPSQHDLHGGGARTRQCAFYFHCCLVDSRLTEVCGCSWTRTEARSRTDRSSTTATTRRMRSTATPCQSKPLDAVALPLCCARQRLWLTITWFRRRPTLRVVLETGSGHMITSLRPDQCNSTFLTVKYTAIEMLIRYPPVHRVTLEWDLSSLCIFMIFGVWNNWRIAGDFGETFR